MTGCIAAQVSLYRFVGQALRPNNIAITAQVDWLDEWPGSLAGSISWFLPCHNRLAEASGLRNSNSLVDGPVLSQRVRNRSDA